MTESVSKIVASTAYYLQQLIDHIAESDGLTKLSENFNLPEFCLKFDNVVKEISKTTTQIAMAYARPPFPGKKECQELMNSIESSSSCLVSLYHILPRDLGNYLHFHIFELVWDILRALLSFIETIDVKGSKDSRERLKAAGNVFSACEKVKDMSKDNLKSVLNFLHGEELLLLESLQEIVQEVLSDFSAQKFGEEIDNSEVWNNEDRELLPPCIALVKTARSSLKKIISSVKANGDCKSLTTISELDTAAGFARDLSPVVIMFVNATYPPMNQKAVKRAAREVVSVIEIMLNKVKTCHFIKEEDHKWLNLLLKSVDHNNNKLQPLLSQESSDECDEIES